MPKSVYGSPVTTPMLFLCYLYQILHRPPNCLMMKCFDARYDIPLRQKRTCYYFLSVSDPVLDDIVTHILRCVLELRLPERIRIIAGPVYGVPHPSLLQLLQQSIHCHGKDCKGTLSPQTKSNKGS